jgi:DHA1 family tetracycline resistance protein-like MFS transporter
MANGFSYMNRSPLFVIFVTVFIDLVGFGIVIPILPYYVESFGGTPFVLGLILTSYSVMQLIFSPILGRLSDRYGRRPVLFVSLIGTGIGFLIMGFATGLGMLFAGRILAGITGGNISTAQAYIADVTTPENRARGMGMFGAAFGLGFIFGPAIGGIMSRWGIHVPVLFAGGLSLANAALLYFTLPETITPGHPARSTRRGWGYFFSHLKERRLAIVVGVYFLFVVSFSIMTTTFTLYTIFRYQYDALHNGYLFAYIGVLAAVVQGGLIGRLVKRFGEAALVIAGALILAVALGVLPYVGRTEAGWHGGLAGLLVLLAFTSLGNSLATPSLSSLASKSVGPAEQGGVMGMTQSAASLARAVGPYLGGWLVNAPEAPPPHVSDHSIFATFWVSAGIMFVAFLLSTYFARVSAGDRAGTYIEA